MKLGENKPDNYDLSSLRLLGTVGEPINHKAWMWYRKKIGNNNCPIVDTWWQTETGANMIAPLPGITETIPGTCTTPLPGIETAIIDNDGNEISSINQGGNLVIKKPWPSMLRGVWVIKIDMKIHIGKDLIINTTLLVIQLDLMNMEISGLWVDLMML